MWEEWLWYSVDCHLEAFNQKFLYCKTQLSFFNKILREALHFLQSKLTYNDVRSIGKKEVVNKCKCLLYTVLLDNETTVKTIVS